MKQRRQGQNTGNKYDLLRATHQYNTRAQGTIVEPMAQHVERLAKNIQGHHQANVVIEPTTGASLEYMHLIKGPTKAILENSFTSEIVRLAQGFGTRIPSGTKHHLPHSQGQITSRYNSTLWENFG